MYYQDNFLRELIVDNFAGGGGASVGIELALGRPVDIAVNHDESAKVKYIKDAISKGYKRLPFEGEE